MSILLGPFFGYFLTGMVGDTNVENWRTMLMARAGVCLLWPVGAALVLIIGAYFTEWGGYWSRSTAIGHVVFSCIGLIPSFNAIRDLNGGMRSTRLTIDHKESAGRSIGYASRIYYTTYEIRLSDGRSYDVTEEMCDAFEEGEECSAIRLPHTDILLDLRPVE